MRKTKLFAHAVAVVYMNRSARQDSSLSLARSIRNTDLCCESLEISYLII